MGSDQFIWMNRGAGTPPRSVSSFRAESKVTGFSAMPEAGDYVISDDLGTLYRLDPFMNVSLLTRLQEPVRQLCWSATGNAGSALSGANRITRIDEKLKVLWSCEVPFKCKVIAIDPFGVFTFAASEEEGAILLDDRGKRAAVIKSNRPLAYAEFLFEEPVIIAAAEHGLLGAYSVSGEKVWEKPLWSNVGGLSISQQRVHIHLAALNHGIKVYDGQGENITGYILEGTVNRIATSYRGQQVLASTVENQLYRLDHDGALLWAAHPESPVSYLSSDPLGKTGVAVFEDNQAVLMKW